MDVRVPSAALRDIPVGVSVPWTALVIRGELAALYVDDALFDGR